MDFNNKRLLTKYKTWVGVQVAFYDFLFRLALENMEATEFTRIHLKQMEEEISDKEKLYEKAMYKINKLFETPEEAWEAFLNIDS